MPRSFLRRILRPAQAAAVIGLASAPFVAFGMPAVAGSAGPAPHYEWWLSSLHITQAWRSADGAGVTVALLSDGVAPGQRYLGDSVVTGPDFTRSGRAPGSRYYGVSGTSLASLIAGHGQAGAKAVDGVAPGAKILSIRVTLSPGDPRWSNDGIAGRLPTAIAQGIRYAANHGATVIELPSDPGVIYPATGSGSLAAIGGSQRESAAVRYAEAKGVVLVAPAGDNGRTTDDVNYPAAYPGVIAVGAFGPGFVKAPFSSRQSYVTLTAAGENVIVPGRSGLLTLDSTTAASAIVTGIAALIRSEFPNLSASQVRSALTESTVFGRKGGIASGSGYGTVDASRAETTAATMSPPHAMPAMEGAVPRSRPVAPVVRSSASVIAGDLTGDAGVSLAALVLLLIPITLYGTMARRRERRDLVLAAERSHRAMNRPGHGTMLADPLLEFFGPQHARPADPASSRPIPTPRFQPRPGLTGRSTMSGSLAARSPLALPPARHSQNQAAPRHTPAPAPAPLPAPAAGLANGGPANRRDPGIVSPEPTVRRTPVSGAPPWEPAMEPTSELPWTVIAPSAGPVKSGGIDAPTIPPPPDSVWDSAPARRSSAPRSLFEPAPPPAPSYDPPSYDAPDYDPPNYDQPSYDAPDYDPPNYDQPGNSQQHPSLPGQPTSWQDLPGLGNARPESDDDRGPIFSWSPTGPTDRRRG